MANQEMVSGAYVEFQKAVLGALPRDISDDLALGWADNGKKLTQVLRAVLTPETSTDESNLVVPPYPALNEVSTLSIPQPFGGIEMVRMDGFSNWKQWQFRGTEITESQTKRFMLVHIGYQPNFDAVKRKLRKHGIIPQGQWRKAFKQAYPKHDGRGPVGVADASWVDPFGDVNFPCIDGDGNENFSWTAYDFNDRWRWLVEAK